MWFGMLQIQALMIILSLSAVSDYKTHRISNRLTMPGWVVGPVLWWLFWGSEGLLLSLQGMGVVLLILLPLWLVKWFGAADIKLLASVGAIVGVDKVFGVLLGVCVVGGLFALSYLIYGKMHKGEPAITGGSADEQRDVIPYAVPIAFGTLLTILYQQIT